jgi:hypothetical protein
MVAASLDHVQGTREVIATVAKVPQGTDLPDDGGMNVIYLLLKKKRRITMKKLKLAFAVLLCLLVVVQPVAAQGEEVPDNPTCTELGYDAGYKLDPPSPGTYTFPDGVHTVTITSDDGIYFDWTSTLGIDAVIVKGGPNANLYEYDPPAESFGDTGLHSPLGAGPDGTQPHAISHIDFCYSVDTAVTGPGSSFNAEASAGRVALTWETDAELDNAGFNLYRALLKDGPYTQINEALIAAQGDAVGGASYSFLDRPDYGTFYYKLEDVNLYGVSTLHGPVKVTLARRPLRSPLYRPRLPR